MEKYQSGVEWKGDGSPFLRRGDKITFEQRLEENKKARPERYGPKKAERKSGLKHQVATQGEESSNRGTRAHAWL
jgi:hypothetical protein